jgi:hypothetical protein
MDISQKKGFWIDNRTAGYAIEDAVAASRPRSDNPICRKMGCQDAIPTYGGHPGIPMPHCTRCGLRNPNATEWAEERRKPLHPSGRFVVWFCEKVLGW